MLLPPGRPSGRYAPALLLVLMLLFSGCESPPPDDLISEDEYINILAEMHLLAAIKNLDGDDKRYRKGQQAVLAHYAITPEQLERSHDFYYRDVDAQQRRFVKARERLNRANIELNEFISDYNAAVADSLKIQTK
ncbi:DUF4296 domain-containing protein [Balneolales bacterium ANBcel1]|nr:DUF4296 domain-containing protein [Balneolales bacterium ANBcel1]